MLSYQFTRVFHFLLKILNKSVKSIEYYLFVNHHVCHYYKSPSLIIRMSNGRVNGMCKVSDKMVHSFMKYAVGFYC